MHLLNILITPLFLTILLSGCVVNNQPDIVKHSMDEIYTKVNNGSRQENLESLRSAFLEQLARKSITPPNAGPVPIYDPAIYIPVTILAKKIKGRSAGRLQSTEIRLYKKGGLTLQ